MGILSYSLANLPYIENLRAIVLTAVALTGNAADNLLAGTSLNDTIDGGTGNDTVSYGGASANYTIAVTSVGFTITSTTDGTDTLKNVEFVSFSNQTITLTALDITAPTVSIFSPADETTSVAIASNIIVIFSEAIVRGTGSIVVETAAGVTVATYDVATSSNLAISGNTLTINPTADLAYSTGYKVEFAAGTIKDLAGNSYVGTTTYNFTTIAAPDTAAPMVSTFSPADEAAGVSVGTNITLTFSEAIAKGTGNIVLKTAAGATVATYDAATSSDLTVSGSTLTINPTADLAYSTGYKVEFAAGTIKDLAGNSYAGTTGYNFTTIAAPNQTLTGTSGNDSFTSGPGNDSIDGGAGIDTVLYSGSLANYTLTHTGSTYTVHATSDSDGTDTLTNIESLKFTDMTVNLTIQAKAAAAAQANVNHLTELYVAFFNRVPDADGLAYWIDQMNAGQSLNQIAESLYSAGVTYAGLTGFSAGMSDQAFINVFYKNVLGRPDGADAGGLAYWSGKLADGSSTRSSLGLDIVYAAHTFKGDPTWGWVADLLDNKIAVAKTFAIDLGLNYNTAGDNITHGMAIAAAVTSTSTDAAIALIGVTGSDIQLG